MLTDEQFHQALSYSRFMGTAHGSGAADWQSQYFPGGGRDTGRDVLKRAQEALDALERGEIEIPSPLSGEYAGDTTVRDLLAGIADELRISTDSLQLDADEFGNEYEYAYRKAWLLTAEQILWARIHSEVQA